MPPSEPATPCDATVSCAAPLVCDAASNGCVACNIAKDCGKAGSLCIAHTCIAKVACTGDKDCKATGELCDLTSGACVGCLKDGDCSGGEKCLASQCVKVKNCSNSKDCANVCDSGSGTCVDCVQAGDCKAEQFCNIALHLCVSDVCKGSACVGGKFFGCSVDGSAYAAAVNCDDGDACTTDSCDAATGCKHAAGALSCDDGNVCTTDSCDVKQGCAHAPAPAGGCEDGSACTTADACAGGKCVGKTADCDDKNVCTTDSCNDKTGCKHTDLDGEVCNADDNACTALDTCKGGVCKAGEAKICKDQGSCVEVGCDAGSGKCTFKAKDGACDDSDPCTSGDLCKDGVCTPGAPKACDDKNPCTKDSCDAKGVCLYTPTTDACDDGDPCTGGDACAKGVCAGAAVDVAKACDDKNVCTTDGCSSLSGCTHVAKAGDCDDGNACTLNDSCQASICTPGAAKVCDDKNPCTKDSCDDKGACQFAPLVGPCDDGNPCTGGDACGEGKCSGTPIDVAKVCDDQNPCTTDSCSAPAGCAHTVKANNPCDDGNPCTADDKCDIAGKCVSGVSSCNCQNDGDCAKQEDGDACNGTLFCDKSAVPYGCKVKPGTVVVCDKGQDTACSTAQCAKLTGVCAQQANADGGPCDDNSACTLQDGCKGGKCVGGAGPNCDDGNPCTVDSCDVKQACVHAPATGPVCDDASACTTGDACKNGVCTGAAKNCDDSNACTADSCDAKLGCKNTAVDGPCSDGDACTVGDVCAAGSCKAGAAKNCDDDDLCTVGDVCANGICQLASPKNCDDGDACTVGDSCSKGNCVPGAPKNCDDGDACTIGDSCANGVCKAGSPKVCLANEACVGGVCTAKAPNGMVLIPAGSFAMGCVPGDANCKPEEKPQHLVTLDAFYVDIYEVTAAKYDACLKCQPALQFGGYNSHADGKEQHPINGITRDMALAYCKQTDPKGSLPTEAQWEKAARGGLSDKIYPWGDTPPTCTPGLANSAVFCLGNDNNCQKGCGTGGTWAVGSIGKPNGYGLYDMVGNAWEYVSDYYYSGYYAISPANNPTGPVNGNNGQVWGARGGGMYSWLGTYQRASYRTSIDAPFQTIDFGFRCVRAL